MNKNNQTISTKCQCQDAVSNPKNGDTLKNVFYKVELDILRGIRFQ